MAERQKLANQGLGRRRHTSDAWVECSVHHAQSRVSNVEMLASSCGVSLQDEKVNILWQSKLLFQNICIYQKICFMLYNKYSLQRKLKNPVYIIKFVFICLLYIYLQFKKQNVKIFTFLDRFLNNKPINKPRTIVFPAAEQSPVWQETHLSITIKHGDIINRYGCLWRGIKSHLNPKN